MRVSPPAENQDYGSHVSPAPQDDTGGGSGGVNTKDGGVAVDTPATTIDATAPISITGGAGTSTIIHDASGVAAATYGSSSLIPVFAVNATGHVTSVTNTSVVAPGSSANFTALFGSGAAGTVTFDGASAVTGFSLVGTTYTCTATAGGATEYINATIDVGVTVKMSCRAIWCTGTLTCNGTLSNNGNDAVTTTAGTLTALDYYAATHAGQAGRTGAQASIAALANAIGGAGGQGGTSVAQPAQAAATSPTAPASQNGGIASAYDPAGVARMVNKAGTAIGGGNGGNSGSGDGTASGAGGAGGGVLGVFARVIAGSGSFQAKGGNGGTSANNTAGGGGGGGGVMCVITSTANWASVVTATVAGGTKGAPSGTASNNATDGAVGRIISMIV